MQIFDIFFKKKPITFLHFRDGLNNFEIDYPKGWHYDKDVAFIDGQYTNCFQSNNMNFILSVNLKINEGFNFKKYAKTELESPGSGIYTDSISSKFRKMPAYKREYSYISSSDEYFGGGVMFFTGRAVFSIMWNAPRSKFEEAKNIFDNMLASLLIR
mgnify:CR=1 FL=1